MQQRERFIAALERKPIVGLVPHFELVFFLTMESMGKVHPTQISLGQWDQMTEKERNLHRNYFADVYIEIAKKYNHSAIFVQGAPGGSVEEMVTLTKLIKEKTNGEYFIMMHGDATYGMPDGSDMMEYSAQFFEQPEETKQRGWEKIKNQCDNVEKMLEAGAALDGICMCVDYCFNTNPFLSPSMFEEFVTPYLYEQIKRYKQMGLYTIKHTDGNIMPIVDQMVDCAPHALHSIDPQANVSLPTIKRLYGDKVCVIGNVNCGLLQTGTNQDVIDDTMRSLHEGMGNNKDEFGYIFSTSNCAYTGLPLERYELMHKVWCENGVYKEL